MIFIDLNDDSAHP